VTTSAGLVPLRSRRVLCYQWLGAKLYILGLVFAVAALAGVGARNRSSDLITWVMYRFAHWDSNLYAAIAIRGYPRVAYPHSYFSFLPGFPWAMGYLGAALGIEVRWAALIIVTISSLACVFLLRQVALELTGSARAAQWGVLAFLVSPMAVFFTIDYAEAPFLALAMAAWLAGRRGAWVWAGILAGLASTLRITGPLVAAALVVMFLTQVSVRGRSWWNPRVLALGLGPVFVLGYAVWLHRQTGSWSTWTSAQRLGFGRATAWPWVGALDAAHKIGTAGTWHLEAVRLLDLLAALGSWVAAACLLRRRWWAEATLAGLCAISLSCSTILDSSPRYLSSVFPLYVLLGLWLARSNIWGRALYLTASVALGSFAELGWGMQWWIA
jgi:hypothetical protein